MPSTNNLAKLVDITDKIGNINDIQPQEFIDYGFQEFSLLDDINIDELKTKELLLHTDTSKYVPSLEYLASPKPQLVVPDGDIALDSLKSVNSLVIDTNRVGSGRIKVVFSVDSGTSWMTYNNTTQSFESLSELTAESVAQYGVDLDMFNSIGSRWMEILQDNIIRFALYLEVEDNSVDVYEILEIRINVDEEDSWVKSNHDRDYNYKVDTSGAYITFLTDGTYKVNYIELTEPTQGGEGTIDWKEF